MTIIFFAIILIIALLGILCFNCSVVWGILAVAAAAGFIALDVIFGRHLKRVVRVGIRIGGAVVCVILMLCMKTVTDSNGIGAYESDIAEAETLIFDDLDRAVKKIGRLEEKYGLDDRVKSLYACHNMVKGDFEAAYEYMSRIEDKTAPEYYIRLEQIYLYDTTSDTTDRLYSMYLEAARRWPEWAYMQMMAGIAQFEQDNIISAEYYLMRAYTLDGETPAIPYYLGAVKFKQGEYEKCLEYFNEALKLGAGEEMQSYILWYLNRIN